MKQKFLNAFVIAMILFQAVLPINALAMTANSNLGDYPPGGVVTFSGDSNTGYSAGEAVHVDVSGPNGYSASCDAMADDNGAWFCTVTLSADAPDGNYSYTATGASSGASDSGSFSVTAPPPPPPTAEPTQEPTQPPTTEPTAQPTVEPTQSPTAEPTQPPTAEPTSQPTIEPTSQPTLEPTAAPTEEPKVEPTAPPPTPTGPVLTPFIYSDKDDYFAGELVTLTSGNWQPGESVHLIVNDVLGDSWRLSVVRWRAAGGTF